MNPQVQTQLQEAIAQNEEKRRKVLSDFTFRRINWQKMMDEFFQLDAELEFVHIQFSTDEPIIELDGMTDCLGNQQN